MDNLSFANPVFATFAIAAGLMILKTTGPPAAASFRPLRSATALILPPGSAFSPLAASECGTKVKSAP